VLADAVAFSSPIAVADDVLSSNSWSVIDTRAPFPLERVLSITTSGGASMGALRTNFGFGGVMVERNTLVRESDEVPTEVRFWAAERKFAKMVLLLKPRPPNASAEPVSGPLVEVEPPLSPSPASPAAVTLALMIEPDAVSFM
jgi:hypothetical protein